MANVLDSVIPKILASMQKVLRARAVGPRIVSMSFNEAAARPGSNITVPFPGPAIVRDAVPSVTFPAAVDTTPNDVIVPINNFKESPFHLTDPQVGQVMEGYLPMQLQANMAKLVDAVDQSIYAAANIGAGAAVGTAGTTPFATIGGAIAPRTLLGTHLVDEMNRHCVFNPDAEANLLAMEQFSKGSYTGEYDAIVKARLNERLGMQWWMTQNVPTHTKGAGTGYLVNNGAGYAVGAKAIVVDTGTGQIKAGDVITIASDPNKYVVAADQTGAGTLTINAPGLKVAAADNAAITILNSHVCNFAWQQDCILFASRPFEPSRAAVASQQMYDEMTGINVRVEVNRGNKMDMWSLDAQWATKVIRPEGVIKILG